MTAFRLDKFIATQLNLSRSECRKLILRGKVAVNGTLFKKPEEKINAETDTVTVMGEKIIYRRHMYLMMNKPKGEIGRAHV